MRTATKVVLIFGVVFLLLGVGVFVLGVGAAEDIEDELKKYEISGENSGTIEIDDSDGIGELGLTFWVKGVYEDTDMNGIWDVCDNTEVTVTAKPSVDETWAENASEMNGDFYYEVVYNYDGNESSDCAAAGKNKENERKGQGLVKIGRACYGCTSGTFEFESNQNVWVSYDDKVGEEVIEDLIGAFFGTVGGSGLMCCGVLFLIIGGILALTLKDDNQQPMMYMPPGNNMMTNPQATQMTNPQFEEPKKYDMPQTTHMSKPTYDEPPQGGL